MMAERVSAQKLKELDFLQFNNLVCETLGGKVIFATDEWFAPAANLLKRDPPVFVSSSFTDFGKWMDGWESRRRRTPGHDWCIIQLGVPGLIFGVDVDTSFFTGNHSPHFSIQATCLKDPPTSTLEGDRTGRSASDSEVDAIAKLHSEVWPELVGMSPLQPGYSDCCHHYHRVQYPERVTHLRLNMFPDGGIARLRVYGVGQRDWSSISPNELVDLVALTNGGVCLGYSDAHFGHPRNMIGPGDADSMADGWETARRGDRPKELRVDLRGILQLSGSEWAVFRLGHRGQISRVQVDTKHFKGNAPDSCWIQACTLTPEHEKFWRSAEWTELLPAHKLHPHRCHQFGEAELTPHEPVTHVRLVMAPDGGISRLRLWGHLPPTASANQKQVTSKL